MTTSYQPQALPRRGRRRHDWLGRLWRRYRRIHNNGRCRPDPFGLLEMRRFLSRRFFGFPCRFAPPVGIWARFLPDLFPFLA